jgi:hypothetical protein
MEREPFAAVGENDNPSLLQAKQLPGGWNLMIFMEIQRD